jgi:hypothetical protein
MPACVEAAKEFFYQKRGVLRFAERKLEGDVTTSTL